MMHKLISENKMTRNKAIFFLIITAILWSFGGLLIKLISWNPIAIAGMRSAIAAMVMFIFIGKPRFTWSLPQIGGAVCYAMLVILFVTANKLTTAANAILLQYTAPVYVAIFASIFLNQHTSKLDWITIIFVMGGMALFFVDDLAFGNMLGNILAILSGICFGSLPIFLHRQKSSSPMETIFLGNIITALISIPFMFQSAPTPLSWLGLVLLGTFQLGLSYVLYALAVKHVTALESLLIPVVEPVLNPIWVFLIMGERPGTWAVVGGVIVLSAVTIRCVIVASRP